MKHERIDPAARVWIVFRGPDGKLKEELDAVRLESLAECGEIADELIKAAGETDAAQTRLW